MHTSVRWFGAGCLFSFLAATALAGTQFPAAASPAVVPQASAVNHAPPAPVGNRNLGRPLLAQAPAVQVPGRAPSGLPLTTTPASNAAFASMVGGRGAPVVSSRPAANPAQADPSRPPEVEARQILPSRSKGR